MKYFYEFKITCEIALEAVLGKRATGRRAKEDIFFSLERQASLRTFIPLQGHQTAIWGSVETRQGHFKEKVTPALCSSANVLFPENAMSYLFLVPNCHIISGDPLPEYCVFQSS